MMKIIQPILTIILFVLTTSLGFAQLRVGESDVQLEQRFIEAELEKILGNYDKALAIYEEILKKDKKNHASAYEIARIYSRQSDLDKAIKSVKTAINLAPGNVWYKSFLVELYDKTGRYKEAAELYEEMVDLEPLNDQLYYRWAFFLVKSNDLNKALKVYDQLETTLGLNEETIRHKHRLYMGMGNHKKAGRELERLIEAFPQNTQYRHLLAEFYLQIGEQGEAQKIYRDILRIDPEDSKAELAATAKKASRNPSAGGFAEQLKSIFEQDDVDIDLKISKIMPLIQEVANSGNKDLAEEILQLTDILEKVHPGEAKAFSASGDLLYYSGRKSEALAKYQKTLELDDTVYLVWEQIMSIHSEAGDYKRLLQASEETMDYFPNKAQAYYFNGLANHELGDAEEAISSLEQALLMAGDDGRLIFSIQSQLALSYYVQEQYNSAQQAFEAALQLNAKAPLVLNNYSYFLAQRGEQLEKAADMARQATQLAPDQAVFQDTYGWVFYKMQDYKKAKEWIGKALKNGGLDKPNILEHYGDVLFQLESKDEAVEYWQKALDQGSKSKLLQKKIADRQLH